MHLKLVSLICCFLLLAYGYADGRQCRNDVPDSVRDTLLEVLNEKCPTSNGYKLSTDSYNCELGMEAFSAMEGQGDNAPFFFDGESTFEFDWKKSLAKAVKVADQIKDTALSQAVTVMCGLLSTQVPINIGCSIELSTSNVTGIHKLSLRCNYKMVPTTGNKSA